MKKLIALVLTLMFTLTAVAAFAEEPAATEEPSKTLVVYYSATGSTERIANMIAEETGADVFVITPVEPYTDEDLNWTNDNSRVVYEHDHPEAQNEVALTEITPENWDNYDTVYIGYPIWWGIAAWPVNQFVTGNDFTGKAVIPFCTSASSGLGQSGTLLAEAAGTGEWLGGGSRCAGVDQRPDREHRAGHRAGADRDERLRVTKRRGHLHNVSAQSLRGGCKS